ncbi:unnamed protein product [Closterium sp. NIES-64]|nr:unnamed protein product [Closterium sp. NIES-64]
MADGKFFAYACLGPKHKFEPFHYEPAPLGPNDVQIKVTHNGLCHTDLHMRDNDWNNATYPLVAGHEVVGIVEQVGANVTTHKVLSDHVAYGSLHDSCLSCVRGEENLCAEGYTGLIPSSSSAHPHPSAPTGRPRGLPLAPRFLPLVPLVCAPGGEPGDRMAYGWLCDSCRSCLSCVRGEENLCAEGYTGLILNGNKGGFQPHLRAPADFAIKLPEGLDSVDAAPLMCAGAGIRGSWVGDNKGGFQPRLRAPADFAIKQRDGAGSVDAAPLMCAGITVYSPLRAHITRPGMKVGVIGIGGLGHLALQIARAMGAHVTAFSTSPSKEEEAKRMGAQQFVVYDAQAAPGKGHPEVPKSAHVDVLVNCAPVLPPQGDYRNFMSLLGPDGTLLLTGIPPDAVGQVGLLDLIFGQKKLAGSVVGGRMLLKEMFDFCAANSIKPVTVGVGGRVLVGVSSIVRVNRAACADPPAVAAERGYGLGGSYSSLTNSPSLPSLPLTYLSSLSLSPPSYHLLQTRPLSQLNEAMDAVLANKVRYRVVLLTDAE